MEQINKIDIINDADFLTSNASYVNLLKEKSDTFHYAEIEPEDLKLLYDSIDINDNAGLQKKVWMDIMLYLIRRGRENLRQITSILSPLTLAHLVKNIFSKLTVNWTRTIPLMTAATILLVKDELQGNPKCPVKNFEDYVSHLHTTEDSLWLDRFNPELQIWYYRAPLGEKPLGNMMAKMSLKYGLENRYTNHSVRVTSLQVLDDNNVKDRHITRVSGHKSLDSIRNYARRLTASKKRSISNVISSTISKPPISNHQINKPPTFQMVDENLFETSPPSSSLASRQVNNNNNINMAMVRSIDNNDDAMFMNIPNNLLTSSQSTTNRISPPLSIPPPVFNNCNNCTINFNIYQK